MNQSYDVACSVGLVGSGGRQQSSASVGILFSLSDLGASRGVRLCTAILQGPRPFDTHCACLSGVGAPAAHSGPSTSSDRVIRLHAYALPVSVLYTRPCSLCVHQFARSAYVCGVSCVCVLPCVHEESQCCGACCMRV